MKRGDSHRGMQTIETSELFSEYKVKSSERILPSLLSTIIIAGVLRNGREILPYISNVY